MSQQPKTIHWGIIGLGKIANKFATDLQSVPNCELHAVASRSKEKANTFLKKHHAKVAYTGYEDLAKDPKIDAVYIATPHSFHKAHTVLCLNNKKAVLCEKPFAMNMQEVNEMITTAKANNTLLMEALWTYFLPHYQYVLNTLERKTYGNILKIEADFGFIPNMDMSSRVLKKELGGGSLLDIGIYPIFAALSTLGNPKSIDVNATFFDNGVDASCKAVFSYTKGVKAYLQSTLLEKTKTQAIFYCERGTITLNSRFHEPTTITLTPNNGKEETIDFNYTTIGYNFETAHFNQLIRDSKIESDIMSFNFSKILIQTLDTVRHKIGLSY